jgi:membrane-bound metal-dependent hydrolase YbcI (DUF457 family)
MLIRTHLAFIVLFLILFVPHVESEVLFIFIALISTMLPDIDTAFSTVGRFKGFRFLQFFVKHRGIFHSFTFAIFISLFLAIFWPVSSLPFFLGYGLHLFVDSFTKEGIIPFWPYSRRSFWRLRTGGIIETTLFLFLILADVLLFILVFWNLL